ncbi:hypothetical protein DNU06_03240 [Putridiphycobacter roseus]|uniref:PD-(D/E)XK endonuclease-like domain-containing protein n=1 Tax=Putridiphycobacter roseus TaxID=2219161 RepID=A0A2W1NVM7_9FLAO|nr:PD-(D/E)XK nuclease family protein [Putridiphycobacter roseus]PZE18858.1 hypothetical protein DNU06_03240 [Putridiphycobacter roseus]
MKSFLEETTLDIYQRHAQEIDQIAIIIPNKRAAVYIQQYLSKQIKQPFFAPKIITINEWVDAETSERILNQTELLFVFYNVYVNYEKAKSESFDEFLKWATIILNDFDEIDRYRIAPHEIFRDLQNIKEIDEWSFDTEELHSGQIDFMNLWDKLPKYYQHLSEQLKEMNATYQGKAYQQFAQKCELIKPTSFKHYYFIGFNAFSQSEQDIISALKKQEVGTIYFDVDQHYVNNKEHEAGHFYRKLRPIFADKIPVPNHINGTAKTIEIVETAQQVAQAKYAGHILKDLTPEEINKTAIVLADESLLIPLSRSLPATIEKANITMGYPLKYSHLKSLVDMIFDLQQNALKFGNKNLYHKTILQFLDHGYIQQLIGDRKAIEVFKKEIILKNKITITPQELLKNLPALANVIPIFNIWEKQAEDGIQAMKTLIQALYENFKKQDDSKSISLEILYHFSIGMQKFEAIFDTYPQTLSLKSFKKLTYQFWQNESLSFLGNPTNGLQVMGILETRTLDFENLIVLGLNEGNLPKNNFSNSLLMRELKLHHHLPVEEDRDAIFAHHFYRLLHRAKKVFLSYNSNGEGFASGEKSRFITQLENELDPTIGHQLNKHTFSGSDKATNTAETVYKLTPTVEAKLDALFERGLSPSALNTFLKCPLDFYYTYILNLREENDVEESIESSTFGTMIHEVLERIFSPFLKEKRAITIPILSQEKKQLKVYLKEEYLKVFQPKDFEFGQNKLSYEVSIKFLEDFIDLQIKELKKVDFPIFVKHLEEDIETTFEWEINGKQKKVKIKGQADRIDQLGSIYRIIDYKSGKCDSEKVKLNKKVEQDGFQSVFEDKENKKAYAIQLLMYASMFKGMFPEHKPFTAGIISMINLKDWVQNVGTQEDENYISDTLLEKFQEELKETVKLMYSQGFEYKHNPKAKYCDYCGN